MLPPFDYDLAVDLPAALALAADGAVPLCGGTELLAAMRMGLMRPDHLVSLRTVAELGRIDLAEGVLRLGAIVTHRAVERSPEVTAAAPLLANIAHGIGNVRVRSSGTIGGNLCFAEPRSDLLAVLVALDAQVVLSGGIERRLPVADFVVGPYETELAPGELLVRVELQAGYADFGVYRKVVASERPIVGVAVVRLARTGRWRVVIGALGDEPVVVEADSLESIDASTAIADLDVIEDAGGSERYKRHLAAVTVERCKAAAAHAVSGGGA